MTDPRILAFLSGVRSVLLGFGVLMAVLHFDHTEAYKWIIVISGSVVAVGSAAWGVFTQLVTLRKLAAAAVQAGINLAVSGQAVTADGKVISQFSGQSDATPPRPVTVATATEIMKDFAPPSSAIKAS